MASTSTPASIELVMTVLEPLIGTNNKLFDHILHPILAKLDDFGLSEAMVKDWQDRVMGDFTAARATALGVYAIIGLQDGGGWAALVRSELRLHAYTHTHSLTILMSFFYSPRNAMWK